MPLVNYSFTALIDTDLDGDNIVASQAVAVRIESDASYANIYSDSAGASPITQPGAATDSNGVLSFYVLPGYYTITSGTRTETVLIDDGSRLKPATLDYAVTQVKHYKIGERLFAAERSSGNGGGAWWTVADATTETENEYNIVTGDTTKCFVLRIIETSYFIEQIGGGSADDTGALNHVITGKTPILSNKTYLFDGVLTLQDVISQNATLKLKDSATVTGGISDVLISFSANTIIEGKLTVDCNKASNASSPPTIGTVPGVGVTLPGGGQRIGHLKVIGSWNNGINHPLANLGDLTDCDIGVIETNDCSGGSYLNFQNGAGRIGKIIANDMNANYTGANPHAVDLFRGEGVKIGSIEVKNSDGTTDAGSAFYSAITYAEWNNCTVGKTNVSAYASTELVPLAKSILNAYRSTWHDTNISNWSQNRHIECLGMQYCSWLGGSVIGAWKETHTGADYTNTLGFIFTNSTVDILGDGADFTPSNNNLVDDFVFENISQAIRDAGNENKFTNVREYGGVNGFSTTNVGENSTSYDGDPITKQGSTKFDNCEFSYNDNAGISANYADPDNVVIANTRCLGNGIDTTASIGSRVGIRMDNADERTVISNYDGRDIAALNVGTLSLSIPVITFALDDLIDICAITGSHNFRAGQRLILTDALGSGVHLTVRVEGNIKARDKFQVRAVSPTTGTTSPAKSSLTGTFSGTIGGTTITGAGTSMRTEVTGKQFLLINGQTFTTRMITSDTSFTVEEPISSTFSGVTGEQYQTSHTSTATQDKAYAGTYAVLKGVQHKGTLTAASTCSGFPMGNSEILKTSSITTSETLSLQNHYASTATMSAQCTGSGNAAAYATAGFPSATQVTVYNQTGTARVFMVTVSE